MTQLDRRNFLRDSFKYAGGALIAAPSLAGLAACNDVDSLAPSENPALARARRNNSVGYGDLVPANDSLPFLIPAGFTLRLISRAATPMARPGAGLVPNAFDGMAAFPMSNGNVRLVRNHEIRDPAAETTPIGTKPWDPKGNAGCTSLEVRLDPTTNEPTLVDEFVSISGTCVNCAGGLTPWRTWMTCEETTEGVNQGRTRKHGYVFEVPADAMEEVTPVAYTAMGRFSHEATAVDPATGIVYLTEDARNVSGFYRFLPNEAGNMAAGGTLQMLRVNGRNGFNATGRPVEGAPGVAVPPLVPLTTSWVTIDTPDPDLEGGAPSVFRQGFAKGGVRFRRLEGCWYADGSIYFNDTEGGAVAAGRVWQYRPGAGDAGQLTLIFESPSKDVLDMPDNITVSPRGGLLLCEDGDGTQFLRGLSRQGQLFDFVQTNNPVDDTELAGACFSPNGRVLFFNQMGSTRSAGVEKGGTYALWGPWERGVL